MANAFQQFLQGQQASMQQGQNLLAQQQTIDKLQKDRELRNILSKAYEAPQAAIPAMGAAPAMGPTMPGEVLPAYPAQAAIPARAGGLNVPNALNAMYQGGFGPEAMELEAKLKPKPLDQFTLSPEQVRYSGTGEVIAKGPEKPKGEKDQTLAGNIRKEFTGQAKDFVKVRDAYRRIEASAKDPSAAGDMALIFNYMKVLDPGSTVREGEVATAEAATGVPERVVNMYNRVLRGERLNPEQRLDFVGRAQGLYSAQEGGLKQLENAYASIAQRAGLNPQDVIVDFRVSSPDEEKPTKAKTPKIGNVVDGYVFLGGDPSNPKSWKLQ